jgi:hypothetical protein
LRVLEAGLGGGGEEDIEVECFHGVKMGEMLDIFWLVYWSFDWGWCAGEGAKRFKHGGAIFLHDKNLKFQLMLLFLSKIRILKS